MSPFCCLSNLSVSDLFLISCSYIGSCDFCLSVVVLDLVFVAVIDVLCHFNGRYFISISFIVAFLPLSHSFMTICSCFATLSDLYFS